MTPKQRVLKRLFSNTCTKAQRRQRAKLEIQRHKTLLRLQLMEAMQISRLYCVLFPERP